MKKHLFIVMIYMLQFLSLFGEAPAPYPSNQAMNLSGIAQDDMLEDIVNEYLPLLEELPEEDLKKLERAGEKMIERFQELGIDPMQAFLDPDIFTKHPELLEGIDLEEPDKESPPAAKPEKPVERPEEPQEEKKDVEEKKPVIISISDQQKLKDIKHKLEDIAEKITSLRQKTESKRSLRALINPFELALSDILYFVLTMKEDHLLRYFIDEKFKPLQQVINELHTVLEIYEPQVHVTEFSLEGEDPYTILEVSPTTPFEKIYKRYQQLSKEENPLVIEAALKQKSLSDDDLKTALQNAQQRWDTIVWAFEALQAKENSKQALELILNALQNALYSHDFINKIKEFLKAYDPEALKIKEEQEKKEKKAREEQEQLARQRAPWAPTLYSPALKPASYEGSFYTGVSFPQSRSGLSTTAKESGTASSSPGSTASGAKKSGDKKKDEEKKDKKEEKKENKPEDKKEKKDDKKGGIDRELFHIEDRLETLQETITEHAELLASLKEYLETPFNPDTDKTKALEINKVLTDITKQITFLEKRVTKDLDKLKDKNNKKSYTEGVSKAYEKFAKDDITKKTLNIIKEFATNEGNILFNNEPLTTNSTKRFLITGVPSRDVTVTDELQRINNPAVIAEGEEASPINYIKTSHDAVNSFEKIMKDKFPPIVTKKTIVPKKK